MFHILYINFFVYICEKIKNMNFKNFTITLFWKQNKHHKHSVLIHTLLVLWYSILANKPKFYLAALLHDIGKPFVATKDEDDDGYSFTNHEEKSYQMIKNIPFISNYTKNIVRYHYLRRRIITDTEKLKKDKNSSNGDPITPETVNNMIQTYKSFSKDFQKDLRLFMILDDKAKNNSQFNKKQK